MKNYSTFLTPLAILCLVGSLAMHGAMALVTVLTAGHVGGDLPFLYMEHLYLPILSIAVPVIGMALFASLLPSIARRHETVEIGAAVENAVDSMTVKEEHHSGHHLKAA